jgi:KaiC/GvpD/RAD55 family RecA-like ATPase
LHPLPELAPDDGSAERGARVVRLDGVQPLPVSWLWRGYVPLGAVTVLDGLPGQGKSTMALDLAARVSTGRAMPDGSAGPEPSGVVVLSAEDDVPRVIVPRLLASGADVSKVATLTFSDSEGLEREPVLSAADLAHVERALRDLGALLLVVDPLVAFMPDGVDTAVDADVRKVLRRLRALAERTGCAVLVIRHPRKATTPSAILSGGGSIGIIGACRSGLLLAPDPDSDGGRVFASSKANLSVQPSSLRLRIVEQDGQPVIAWQGPCGHTADGLLAAAAEAQERRAREESRARETEAKAEALDGAAAALRAEVIAWHADGQPMRAREDAVPFLLDLGVSRDAARGLLRDRDGQDWRLDGGGRRGAPHVLLPVDSGGGPYRECEESASKKPEAESPRLERPSEPSILADRMNTGPPETPTSNVAPEHDLQPRDSGGRMDSGPPESTRTGTAIDAGFVTAAVSGGSGALSRARAREDDAQALAERRGWVEP